MKNFRETLKLSGSFLSIFETSLQSKLKAQLLLKYTRQRLIFLCGSAGG
jgi:hypothetical protein